MIGRNRHDAGAALVEVERPLAATEVASTQERFAQLLSRIAAATQIKRVRTDEEASYEAHGGPPAQLAAKMELVLPDLERLAQRLEA